MTSTYQPIRVQLKFFIYKWKLKISKEDGIKLTAIICPRAMDRAIKTGRVSTQQNPFAFVGSIAQWLAYLLLDPAAPGSILRVPKKISEERVVNVGEENQWCCLEQD